VSHDGDVFPGRVRVVDSPGPCAGAFKVTAAVPAMQQPGQSANDYLHLRTFVARSPLNVHFRATNSRARTSGLGGLLPVGGRSPPIHNRRPVLNPMKPTVANDGFGASGLLRG